MAKVVVLVVVLVKVVVEREVACKAVEVRRGK